MPADRYWGAQSQRSLGNFKIGWEKQPLPIVRALGVGVGYAISNAIFGGSAALVTAVSSAAFRPSVVLPCPRLSAPGRNVSSVLLIWSSTLSTRSSGVAPGRQPHDPRQRRL